ncbi:MAG: ketoisovalerate oxidoreductase subunit VorB [Nitrospirae bacterium]|jgi:2-oxoglutarate ferredoxin oxidoreductase subunit alpha|nr:ketoisovalerate oxidoreductase subunit VorB [Nitrospirota bacterium]
MAKRKMLLKKGNEALAEAAIQAGCRFYAGYPITPQNEIPEYMSRRMPEVNGVFIQAESEIASINMVYGASAAGVRAMTSSSGPGISLKQETISFLAGAELPSVIVNIQRGGPGLGNITASQGDYFQAVKGGGHGDYKCMVFSPFNVQEMWDLTMRAFDKADEYRIPVIILGDGVVGQMMEPFHPTKYVRPHLPEKDWILNGCRGRKPRVIRTLFMAPGELERRNLDLQKKYLFIRKREVMYNAYDTEDAEVVVVAFGIAARIALSAVKELRREGRKAGLFRPVTLFPFPEKQIADIADRRKRFLVIEMNAGQMVEDVRLAVNGKSDVLFYGRPGGAVFNPEELYRKIKAAFPRTAGSKKR